MTHKHHGAGRVHQATLSQATAVMNMTPMIDVLLVLLVIFMAAIPLSQRGLDATLPPAVSDAAQARPEQIVVEYNAEKKLSINEGPVETEGMRRQAAGGA